MSEKIIMMPSMAGLQSLEGSEISTAALADFHQGIAMLESGNANEAVTVLTHCVEQAPAFTAGHVCLGVAHAVSCNVYPAIDHLQKATELSPEDFVVHYTLAKFYFKLRIPLKGYECANRALECSRTREHRLALSQLLKQERKRERNGIARPLFNRKLGLGFGVATVSAIAGLFIAIVAYFR